MCVAGVPNLLGFPLHSRRHRASGGREARVVVVEALMCVRIAPVVIVQRCSLREEMSSSVP